MNVCKFVETKWRDLFLLHYTPNSLINGEKDIHWDFSGLSMVGCLTDDYEGGEMELFDDTKIKLNRGEVIIFPSVFMYPHKICEVTKGTRYSFVSWVY